MGVGVLFIVGFNCKVVCCFVMMLILLDKKIYVKFMVEFSVCICIYKLVV